MNDFINRQDAIDAVLNLSDKLANEMLFIDAIVDEIENLPSAEPLEDFEWCTDCKEYDQEKHCCHRWTKVIRQTVEEMQMMGKIAKVIEHDASITDTDGYKYLRTEYICGNCKKKVIFCDEYCSHCGARLEWNHE